LDNANTLADGIKVMEQVENAVSSTVQQVEKSNKKPKTVSSSQESDSTTVSYYDQKNRGKFIRSERVANKDLDKK
ncbi:hypothetical protein BWK59_15065, partial [Flavobacterium davisii]